jgi:hypothetical protein
MKSYRLVVLFFLLTVFAIEPMAQARTVSRNNPFRTFNLSGINYGSMRWEIQDRCKQKAIPQPRVRLFRR